MSPLHRFSGVAFNRTIVELKSYKKLPFYLFNSSFNRTIVELKYLRS